MHNHSCRLVDNDQMIILENDSKLNIFGNGSNVGRLLESDFINLAFNRGRLAVSSDPAIARDSAFGNESTKAGSAEVCLLWHIAGKRLIKARRWCSADLNADDA
jgi:hypothetical protein